MNASPIGTRPAAIRPSRPCVGRRRCWSSRSGRASATRPPPTTPATWSGSAWSGPVGRRLPALQPGPSWPRCSDPSAPAAGETWALVSLDALPRRPAGCPGCSTAPRWPRSTPGCRCPGVHTQVVRIPVYRLPADVMAGMLDAARPRDQEQAEYLPAGSPADRRRPEPGAGCAGRTTAAAHGRAAEAAAYRSGLRLCLRRRGPRRPGRAASRSPDRPEVRAVDPAPEVRSLDRTEFRPPLPEQDGHGSGATGSGTPQAVPNDGSGIASRMPAPILSSLGAPVTSASPGGSDPRARFGCPGTGGAHCCIFSIRRERCSRCGRPMHRQHPERRPGVRSSSAKRTDGHSIATGEP